MFKKLVALSTAAAAIAVTAIPTAAQCCGFGGFPFWGPWGSGWGCWGYGCTGIHLFSWCHGFW